MNAQGERVISLVDGELSGIGRATLRIAGGRIIAIDARPGPDDVVVELRGHRVLPGLINGHDHLQLNNFPRVRYRERHENVGEWISDIETRRGSDLRLAAASGVPREARLWQGALKNLLAGVTTVAHHDPLYEELKSPRFPIRTLTSYGWAHSLGLDGDTRVRETHRATPDDQPWFIHAGEGVDAEARSEFARLEALGCLTGNTRLIHGIAFGETERARLVQAGAALIWCPASNLYLFGRTAEVSALVAQGRVALGSDSRLSGSADLLAELQVASETGMVPHAALEALVTTQPARLFNLADRGVLREGSLADIVILPREMPLWRARRVDIRCVMIGGEMVCGDAEFAALLMGAGERARIEVDGAEKILRREIVDVLRDHGMDEGGVQFQEGAGRAA
jgi:cytosine/adenosine deaminase-related metal-dependent hydrolase